MGRTEGAGDGTRDRYSVCLAGRRGDGPGRVGRYAAEHGVDLLIGVRGAARWMVEEARAAGMDAAAAVFLDDAVEAGEFARAAACEGDAVLFKGSRGVRVERAMERFIA